MDKNALSERDITTKYVLPALARMGWDVKSQVREEFAMSAGRVIAAGRREQSSRRGVSLRADVVLFYRPNVPVAVIEVKDNKHSVGAGIQQALRYGELLGVPLAYSTNGDAFLESDVSGAAEQIEREIPLHGFPSPDELWRRYCAHRGIGPAEEPIAAMDWYRGMEDKEPRYYQIRAVNLAVEAIAKGQDRLLLVMATGTGKTFTAFQIIWRLWKAKAKKRVLFLADRNILLDQAKNNDFQPFDKALTKVLHRQADKSFEIYLALYQAVSGSEEQKNIYKQFSPGFFDLIVVDECHRGSAAEDSAWREVLKYFESATQIGMTATPKETEEVSNIDYFGEPIYTYSLKRGIDDGYLAPYKVIRIDTDKDIDGYTPEGGKRDKYGHAVPNRKWKRPEFDRTLVLEKRTELVARKVSDYLKHTNRFSKTIVFCQDIEHAERMRSALVRENADLALESRRYVRKITGDDPIGRHELDEFILPRSRYPVIATTSKLMSTGVDAQTVKLIVIDQEIGSRTEFKQIIGRGTRIREDEGKLWFTIMDFRGATRHFEDADFDGPAEKIYEPKEGDPIVPPEDDDARDAGAVDPGSPAHVTRAGRRQKLFIDDVEVVESRETTERFDKDGKRVEASLEEHARRVLLAKVTSLPELRRAFVEPEARAALLGELEGEGVSIEDLGHRLGEDFATYDLLAHVAFAAAPLTRRQRSRSLPVRKLLGASVALPRAVLEGLLDKFVAERVDDLDGIDLLRVQPFDQMGTLVELVRAFGGRAKYEEAVAGLLGAIYGDA